MLDALVGVAPLGFLLAAVVIIITPGPDMTLAARNTIRDGRIAGFQTIAGILTGILAGVSVHVAAAAAGLSAVLASSAEAFTVVKIAGAAYLIYLGLRTLWPPRRHGPADDNAGLFNAPATPVPALSPSSPAAQGFLSALLNPKLALFFLTFLPQFVDPENMPGVSMLAHGLVFVLMGAAWLCAWVLSLDRMSVWLRRSVVRLWMERATGVVLVALGVRLALARR